jgi:membrane protein
LVNITSRLTSTIDHIKGSIAHSRLAQNRLVILAWRVFLGMGQDDAGHLAAGVAYYAIFSLFPLLLGVLAIMGLVLDSEELQQRFLQFVTESLPGSADFVANNVRQIVRYRGALGIGAIIGLLWSGRAVFAAVSRAINRAWSIRKDRPFYIAIPRQLAMVTLIGGLLLLSAAATSFIQVFNDGRFGPSDQEPLLDLGLSYLALYLVPGFMTLIVFLLLYRFVPNRQMRWRYVWPGALVATVLFEVSKSLFLWYLENFAVYNQVYGSLASVIVLLFWAYLSSLILILGAEVSYEYERLYYPEEQSNALSRPNSHHNPKGPPVC